MNVCKLPSCQLFSSILEGELARMGWTVRRAVSPGLNGMTGQLRAPSKPGVLFSLRMAERRLLP